MRWKFFILLGLLYEMKEWSIVFSNLSQIGLFEACERLMKFFMYHYSTKQVNTQTLFWWWHRKRVMHHDLAESSSIWQWIFGEDPKSSNKILSQGCKSEMKSMNFEKLNILLPFDPTNPPTHLNDNMYYISILKYY